jgi:hypothetical protein
MANGYYPRNLLAQAQAVQEALKEIDAELAFGDLTQTVFAADLTRARDVQQQIDALNAQLTDLENQSEAMSAKVWDNVKRTRASIKGIYGDDSSQYEMVGGTRASDRKKPARKTRDVVTPTLN